VTGDRMTALEPRHLAIVERWTLIASAVVIAASLVAAPRAMAFAVAVGAGLMTLNAWAIRKIAERVVRRAGELRPGVAVLLFNLKMFALIALVYLCVKVLGLDGIGFIIGVSVFPVAIVIAALRLNLGADDAAQAPTSPASTDRQENGNG
jgi:hypothetical protein